MQQSVRATLIVTAILFVQSFAAGQQWTRFRGPNGSGLSEAKSIPVTWKENDYNWKIELPGRGHSSPVVWGKRVFVTSADEDKSTRFLQCIDAADGNELWRRQFPFEKYKHHRNNSAASNTPAVDAERVYVLWQSRASSPLIALDHQGNEVWRYDLGPYLHGQGGGTSPIVYTDMVVVCNDHKQGSFLLAVDRHSGNELWKVPRKGKRACYATPCVFQADGRPDELIFSHCFEGIIGVEPSTGKQKWMIDVFGTHPQRAVGSPIVADDLIVANSGAVAGAKTLVAVKPTKAGDRAEEIYRITRNAPHVPTALAYNGLLFLWSDQGIVTCARAASGKTIWQKRIGGNYFGSPVCVDGKIYCVSADGEVVVIAASDEFAELARNQLGETSHATPAVSGGKMFIRTVSHLYCVGGE